MKRSLASRIETAHTELLEQGHIDAIGTFFAPDYVAHGASHNMIRGHAGIRRFVNAYRRSFPDLQVEVEILVKAKNRIAWQRTLRATHERSFKGFPATGRRVVWRDMVTSRFHADLIAEDWVISDLAERLLLARKRA